MSTSDNRPDFLIAVAALSAACGVALGAYGAHGLAVDPSLIRIWETAVAYQMWHALGAMAAAWLAARRSGRIRLCARLGGWLMLAGAALFTVSLYVFVIDGIVPVMGLAPAGGFMMIGGWCLLCFAALRPGKAIF